MIRRLRVKFVCITMAFVSVMLTLMLVLQYRSTEASLENASLRALESAASGPMMVSRPGMGNRDVTQPCFTLSRTAWGDLLVSGSEYYDLTDTRMLLSIYLLAEAAEDQTGILTDYNLRFYRTESPVGVRFVFTDISGELAALEDLVKSFVLIGTASFFGFLIISILLAFWAVRPVEKAWEQQRQFVADASHELKTPLTVILTNAELMQDPGYDEQQRQQFTGNILAMSGQMRGLVESLLQLARVDNGKAKAETEKFDYSKLVCDAALPFEPVYFEQGLTLEVQAEPDIFVTGSPAHLRQVVEILLDNGQKYSVPEGAVQMTLSRQGHSQCLLRVTSRGREMTARECRDIFKRFYRGDTARSMNRSYGLGLAIAQRIVTDHRGKIWATSQGGVNTFHVMLPC